MSIDWSSAPAPTLADFEAMAAAAWNRLPGEFRAMAGDIVIRVDEIATDEMLDALGIDDPFELTGLYQGVSLNHQSVMDVVREPEMIFLFRRAILDEWTSGDEELGHLIANVLIHEIGHHFGLSDDDIDAIEAEAAHDGANTSG
jgi:predicted Zn-dependent protease with MMP-like domain